MNKNSKYGRNPKLNPKTHCVMVRFDDVEWNKFLTMYEESQVYAKAVFLKAHFFGQKFKMLKVDKAMQEYHTKLSDFHAQFCAIGTNYNQVVKELRCHFSEKKAMALLYRLGKHTIDLVKLSREIVELSREMQAKWNNGRNSVVIVANGWNVPMYHLTQYIASFSTGHSMAKFYDTCILYSFGVHPTSFLNSRVKCCGY